MKFQLFEWNIKLGLEDYKAIFLDWKQKLSYDVTKTVTAVTFYRVTAVTALTYLGKLCGFFF
jgi:hypothetical protein